MKSKFFKRIAMLAVALTVCVVGASVQNTSYAANLAQTKKLAVTVEENQVKLTWNKVSGAKKYQVYRATSQNGKYKLVKTTTSRKWTDSNRKGECWYKVRAVNGKKTGKFSAKNHTFRINAKITGFSNGAFKVKITNLSTSKPIYFVPGSGLAAVVLINKTTGANAQYSAGLSPNKIVTVPKKGSKTISVKAPSLTTFNKAQDEAAVVAAFTISKSNPKYVYAVGAFYNTGYTYIDKAKA
ncbi:MAG: hypothetical protein Q4F79_00760 [Eubacteriales bacterium]|nr:hypothetical protein [Eubacteriales bacterium]